MNARLPEAASAVAQITLDLQDGRVGNLALQIADSTARSAIEVYCEPVVADHSATPIEQIRNCWYDSTHLTPADRDMMGVIAQAVEYLTLRGKLLRHPDHAHLVRPTA